MAFPFKYAIDPSIIGTDEATKCAEACAYNAVDLDMQPEKLTFNVGAVVWATGLGPVRRRQHRLPRIRDLSGCSHQRHVRATRFAHRPYRR